jgi:hypothetical protein
MRRSHMHIRSESRKVHLKFFSWPSIILSLFLTMLLNLIFKHYSEATDAAWFISSWVFQG